MNEPGRPFQSGVKEDDNVTHTHTHTYPHPHSHNQTHTYTHTHACAHKHTRTDESSNGKRFAATHGHSQHQYDISLLTPFLPDWDWSTLTLPKTSTNSWCSLLIKYLFLILNDIQQSTVMCRQEYDSVLDYIYSTKMCPRRNLQISCTHSLLLRTIDTILLSLLIGQVPP